MTNLPVQPFPRCAREDNSPSSLIAYLYAALAAALTNVQVGADLKLFRGLQNPALTAVVILVAGLLVATLALLVWSAWQASRFRRADLAGIPWWAWAGGGCRV